MPSINVDPRLRPEHIKRYDEWMDFECVKICDALNTLPGIETFESCCGHAQGPFMVFFSAESIECLRPILVEINEKNWIVEVTWASGGGQIYFGLISQDTDVSNCQHIYTEANEIAEALS
jgi:hypothetical protein